MESRTEKILRSIIDDTQYSEAAQSRVEKILLAIKNDTQYSEPAQSRIEEILLAIKNDTQYSEPAQSRIEEILLAKLNGTEYNQQPRSRIEELLIEWIDAGGVIEGIPPLSYKADEGTLKNYRIYGNTVNGENVGDLITEGEHAGEYRVPVTVEGKNLLQNTAKSQTKNGVTFTVNADKSITCNGTAPNTIYFAVKDNVALESGTYVLTGCPLDGGQNTFKLYAQTTGGAIFYVDEGAGAIINYKSKITILITILSGYTCNNLTFYPMIRKPDIEDDTYEPYHAPVTTPIYLPEQIKKVGDEAEYIDFKEQKIHFADGTSVDVTLPALPTISGTNILSVNTEVQPSKVYVKGEKQRN